MHPHGSEDLAADRCVSQYSVTVADLGARKVDLACCATCNDAAVLIDVGLSALKSFERHKPSKIVGASIGIAWRAGATLSAMPGHLGRIDTLQPNAR